MSRRKYKIPPADVYSDGKHTIYRFGSIVIGAQGRRFAGVVLYTNEQIVMPPIEYPRRARG